LKSTFSIYAIVLQIYSGQTSFHKKLNTLKQFLRYTTKRTLFLLKSDKRKQPNIYAMQSYDSWMLQ